MGFLVNLGKAISDVGNTTLQKGKDAVNVAKYNRLIADEEREITKVFEKIGQKYFEEHSEDGEYADLIEIVKGSYDKIKEYQDVVNDLQGIIICETCGSSIPRGAAFCPECGIKVEIKEEPEKQDKDPDKIYCECCGAEVAIGNKFCMACGAKIEIPEPEPAEEAEPAREAEPICENEEA